MRRPFRVADNGAMNTPRVTLIAALVTTAFGATFISGAPPVSAGGYPPTLNCRQNVCTLLTSAATDSDGDGYTDADEKLFGSDPYDASSCPSVIWLFDRIADATLPGFWIDPMIDLVTISPDGQVVTATLLDAMGSLGLTLPAESNNFGLTLAPAGVDLGTIGGSLDWQIHGESTSKNPPPPDAPDSSLYGFAGGPPSDARVEVPNGHVFVHNGFSNGEATSTVFFHNKDGSLAGVGNSTGKDGWAAQSAAVADGTPSTADPETAAAIAKAIEAETKRLAAEEEQRAAAQAKREQDAKEQAEQDAADAKAAAAAAAKKAAEEAAKKAADEAEKDHGGLTNPDAESPIDVQHLTAKQVAALVAAGSGSYFANVGDTGVIAMFTPSEYIDPTIFIVHIDPTADPSSEGGASSTPDLDNEAAPEYDPNLPVIGTTGDPVRPPGEPPH